MCVGAARHRVMAGQYPIPHGKGKSVHSTPGCAWQPLPAARWLTWPENLRSPAAPCLADAANRAISLTRAPPAHRPVRCAGYSVCKEFAHGRDPATVWRTTQEGRRVSWLNLVLHLLTACMPKSLATSPFPRSFRANLDRKRQIWPAAWCGLHYVRPH